MLQSMGSQRIGHDLASEQQQYGSASFNFLRASVLFSLMAVPLPFLSTVHKGFSVFADTCYSRFFDSSHFDGCEVTSH